MNRYFEKLIDQSIDIWFAEDIGEGDHTTLSTIPETVLGQAKLIAKERNLPTVVPTIIRNRMINAIVIKDFGR